MIVDFLLERFSENENKEAIVWQDRSFSYGWLLEHYTVWRKRIADEKIEPGTVVMIEADFSPNSIALFIALLEERCIIVPLTRAVASKKEEFIRIAQGEILISITEDDNVHIGRLDHHADHAFYGKLKKLEHPGLVVFSSGSTGKNKASVHDMMGLLDKFRVKRHALRTVTFLLYDHLGGLNTLLYILSNAGCIVTVTDRSPDGVLSAVEKYSVELLPTSPTFINLILLSEAYKRYDVSSLQRVTYGTEPMPESTLKRFHQLFPDIELLQTYGLSEVGVLRSKSKGSDSLWFKIGGEGFETRIVDGLLEIKAKSAMLGYLNAPSPFTEDGWFMTGDAVEIDGEYIRILGRKSEIINVGGLKVYPQEVESVIQEIDNVAEVTVYGEKNPITGMIVAAKIRLKASEERKSFTSRLKKHCRSRLQNYKIPVKVKLAEEEQYSSRYKKIRANV